MSLLVTDKLWGESTVGIVMHLMEWAKSGPFSSLRALLPLVLASVVGAQTQPIFSDDFSGGQLDTTKWRVASWLSADSKHGINQGTYVPENIDLSSGMLRITVTQTPGVDGMISKGGAIQSRDKFGFGTNFSCG